MPDMGSHALSLHHINHIAVDTEQMIVTVGAGATVREVLEELSRYGLTLENFSSIQEQQMAGWTQVAAHGTGCSLPTVEEQIVSMKVCTPTEGYLTLSEYSLPSLFRIAKVGLGSVGVVTELKLKCIPKMLLAERTVVLNRGMVFDGHYDRLRKERHVRYMWIPYNDAVVCVTSSITSPDSSQSTSSKNSNNIKSSTATDQLVSFILSRCDVNMSEPYLLTQGVAQLRDIALGADPLNSVHVKAVNTAEADYWRRAAGVRVDDSASILGFDCGGEQWVLEMCFPIGSLQEESGKDIAFVQELLSTVEERGIPAPGPIEQRWTARSTAPMSPAYSENPDDKFCWVGIIMYLPANQSTNQRENITKEFMAYCDALKPLMNKYNAQVHWAKIELPRSGDRQENELATLQSTIRRKYPVDEFNAARKALDPRGILSNNFIESLFNDKN
eukprot:CAMPEP_0185040534 /NCGR_PEP_ID=MMETSP1103-20130426/38737_1 /TAXON_ID=36769 /ORGANISM="Paraphysomonas bandaiensis, Strain Caron Lab Isolate" /LENGTH=443 /DNA_ID=CAMNT_0027579889 /DNA_START=210 /DNA_END=1541 /DNA_ORIENTATION=+